MTPLAIILTPKPTKLNKVEEPTRETIEDNEFQ